MASTDPKQETRRDDEMEIVEDEETKKLRLEKEARAAVISGEEEKYMHSRFNATRL